MDFTGKHVLVTGAAKRVGAHLAQRFWECGANLSAHFFQTPLPRAAGDRYAGVQADLRQEDEVKAAVETACKRFGAIDILICSASQFHRTPLSEISTAQWDELNLVNLRGQFLFCQAAATQMVSGGVILTIADTQVQRVVAGYAPYLAAKGGLVTLTKAIAKELASRGIRANVISPGWVLPVEGAPVEQAERNIRRTLLQRMGDPEDIFQAARFLALAPYITGFNLVVDGGREIA